MPAPNNPDSLTPHGVPDRRNQSFDKTDAEESPLITAVLRLFKNANLAGAAAPLALVKTGINFVSLLPKDARKDVEKAISESGFDFGLTKMRDAERDSLLSALQESRIDVETKENITFENVLNERKNAIDSNP